MSGRRGRELQGGLVRHFPAEEYRGEEWAAYIGPVLLFSMQRVSSASSRLTYNHSRRGAMATYLRDLAEREGRPVSPHDVAEIALDQLIDEIAFFDWGIE